MKNPARLRQGYENPFFLKQTNTPKGGKLTCTRIENKPDPQGMFNVNLTYIDKLSMIFP